MELNIQHDENNSCFYVDISGETCKLDYRKIDDETLEYYHTYVPESLRHQGIAGKMTAFALEYAASHQYYVVPTCPYVKKYLSDHPEYSDVIKI